MLNLKVKQYEAGQKLLLVFETGMTALQIRQFCDRLLEGGKAETAAVFSEDAKDGFHYCAGSRSFDMRQAGKTLNGKLNGRGGGSAQMIQGTFKASEEEIRNVFEEIF